MRQEIEQEDFELRDIKRQETERGRSETVRRGFFVFTYDSRIFAGRIAHVNIYGSITKPINVRC
jgi:hypothetical protein